jgi:Sulfatase
LNRANLLTHPATTALGLSLLSCLGIILPLISPSHLWVYHNSGPVASVFEATALNLGILWLFLTALLLRAQRPGRFHVAVWLGIILMSPWILLVQGPLVGAWNFSHWLRSSMFAGLGLCWIATLVFWRESFLPVFGRLKHLTAALLGCTALLSVVFLSQLMWNFGQARASNLPRPMHQRKAEILNTRFHTKPRIIWIVLDELSYQQVYERRFPGLKLPAFDRLARQSTIFTHVVPAGFYTEKILPSLISGLPIDQIRSSADGSQLFVHDPTVDRWKIFESRQTIFQDALDNGYSTAVAGWYNPYCRILATVLDRCFWTSRAPLAGGMSADAPILSNLAAPWLRMSFPANALFSAHNNLSFTDKPANEPHVADYRDLLSDGDQYLSDPSIGFLLLHMPIPHPNGIYDRRIGAFTTRDTSYIDNLALADAYLDHVSQILERQNEWDSSAIVVMGDHSWRMLLRRDKSPSWTAEDEAASHGGQFDDRPAYIIKLPGQQYPLPVGTSFAATKTRSLIRGMMKGTIRAPADLVAFAEEERR